MIGAAGGAPVRGRRAGRAGPRRPAVAAAGRSLSAAGRARRGSTRPTSGPTLRRGRAPRAPRAVAELPRRRRRPRGDPAEAAPAPGRRVLEIGPGLGLLTGGLLDAGARSPPSSSIAGSRRSCATGSTPRSRRPLAARSRATRSTRTSSTSSTAVRRRGEPAVPHHQPDPASAPRRAAATGAARAHGPARGRRADRGAARAR